MVPSQQMTEIRRTFEIINAKGEMPPHYCAGGGGAR